LGGDIFGKRIIKKINNFVKEGGILITNEGSGRTISPLVGNENNIKVVNKIKNGYIILHKYKNKDFGEYIINIVYNIKNKYPWEGIPEIDMEKDGVYATRFNDKIMYYNSNNYKVNKKVKITNSFCKEFKAEIDANSIISVKI